MKIKSIEETSWNNRTSTWYSSGYDGFVITFEDDKQIKMGISNGQSCCEQFGYLMSQDDFSDFIGAGLLNIEGVDSDKASIDLGRSLYTGNAMFINVYTTAGLLQFVAYNEHNGYYSHEAVVIENGTVTISESL
jgi:hypothetical protein